MSQFLDLHCNLKLQIYLSYTLHLSLFTQSTITSVEHCHAMCLKISVLMKAKVILSQH